ncbi:DUF1833 family protein [Candidatus Pacearchaeota archaeon]|nr:DUF1833 family protein [Candidatus Pacearchaeota archaeon]
MPRVLSSDAVIGLLSENTDEVYLIALKITGTGFSPLYLVNNLENVTMSGELHLAFPFTVILPNESKDKSPKASIRIDNLSQTIIERIRSIQGRPTFELSIRLASSPDTVEVGPITLDSSGADWDDTWISLLLVSKNLLNEPWPYRAFSPIQFPGLFQ